MLGEIAPAPYRLELRPFSQDRACPASRTV